MLLYYVMHDVDPGCRMTRAAVWSALENNHPSTGGGLTMPQYLYQLAYTPESLAAQMKNPQDRVSRAPYPALALGVWSGSRRVTTS